MGEVIQFQPTAETVKGPEKRPDTPPPSSNGEVTFLYAFSNRLALATEPEDVESTNVTKAAINLALTTGGLKRGQELGPDNLSSLTTTIGPDGKRVVDDQGAPVATKYILRGLSSDGYFVLSRAAGEEPIRIPQQQVIEASQIELAHLIQANRQKLIDAGIPSAALTYLSVPALEAAQRPKSEAQAVPAATTEPAAPESASTPAPAEPNPPAVTPASDTESNPPPEPQSQTAEPTAAVTPPTEPTATAEPASATAAPEQSAADQKPDSTTPTPAATPDTSTAEPPAPTTEFTAARKRQLAVEAAESMNLPTGKVAKQAIEIRYPPSQWSKLPAEIQVRLRQLENTPILSAEEMVELTHLTGMQFNKDNIRGLIKDIPHWIDDGLMDENTGKILAKAAEKFGEQAAAIAGLDQHENWNSDDLIRNAYTRAEAGEPVSVLSPNELQTLLTIAQANPKARFKVNLFGSTSIMMALAVLQKISERLNQGQQHMMAA